MAGLEVAKSSSSGDRVTARRTPATPRFRGVFRAGIVVARAVDVVMPAGDPAYAWRYPRRAAAMSGDLFPPPPDPTPRRLALGPQRSEERRVGQAGVGPCRSRWV